MTIIVLRTPQAVDPGLVGAPAGVRVDLDARPLAVGTALDAVRALLPLLTPAELNELKLKEIGAVQRELARDRN